MDTTNTVMKCRHVTPVAGLGVFIAPKVVARLFSLTDYSQCVKLLPPRQPSLFDSIEEAPPVLYPLLLPNVLKSPRYYHVTTRARARKEACRNGKI